MVMATPTENGQPPQKARKHLCAKVCGCYERVKRGVANVFRRYGTFVGTYPLPFIVLPIITLGGLGLGFMAMESESDTEKIYFPINARAFDERDIVMKRFPQPSHIVYSIFADSFGVPQLSLMFFSNGDNLLETNALTEILNIVLKMNSTQANSYGQSLADYCLKVASECVFDGKYVLDPTFLDELSKGSVTYPLWTDSTGTTRDVSTAVSAAVTRSGVLISARVLKISLKMHFVSSAVTEWFQNFARGLNPQYTTVAYEFPDSLNEELDESTKGDIAFFAATIALCCAYACLVTSGGNPVSTRVALAFAGIFAAGLSILGAMGLLSVCGVDFVNIVGVLPFLIIGIGIDDMFLLMSAWSETLDDHDMTVPARLGACLATAGVGITITSLTDFLAFAIGTTSIFRSVINFSLYAGVAVLFCYLVNATMFAACLAIHGRRVYSSRHFLTCRPTKTRQEQLDDGASSCKARLCGGAIPEIRGGDESLCERLPRSFLPKIIEHKITRVIIILAFMGYLAAVIYGTIHLKQGLLLQDLVQPSSYYYNFLVGMYKYFPESLPISFVIDGPVDYSDPAREQLKGLLVEAKKDPMVISDFERCWFFSYLNSTFYDSSAPNDFVKNLQYFLNDTPDYFTDVKIYDNSVTASRCFVLSEKSNDQYAQADMMDRLRKLADSSSLPVFVYHSMFPAYEQFLAILPATLQLLGSAVGAITVVTFLFLPHLLMVFLVVVTILMILTGILGFMYYWDITLSAITMIHLVMSVGFSVDFSAHVCAAYLMSESAQRHERAVDAVRHAASPVLNGATSTLVGILFLAMSESYVFLTFFKIMLLVILLGVAHAVLFLPAVLALIGPHNSEKKTSVVPSPKRTISTSADGFSAPSTVNFQLEDMQNRKEIEIE